MDPSEIQRTAADLARDGVVHDVNQLLSIITGRAEFLLGLPPSERGDRDLASILAAARDAATVLKRLGGGAGELAAGGDVAAAAAAALDAVRPPDQRPWRTGAGDGGWWAENRVPAGLVSSVPAAELREVLRNLLLNALAAMPEGGGVILEATEAAERIRLTVTDTGPGVAAGAEQRVFAPGHTTSGDAARGVGLAACRSLLTGRGAALDLAPPGSGRGARFVLDLPRGRTAPRPSPPAPARAVDLPPARVLVVDDEASLREFFADVLTHWGCEVEARDGAKAARDGFARGRCAVALIDWTLPGESGLELAGWMRRRDPALAIVVMTGVDRGAALDAAAGAETDFTLNKPLDLDELRRTLAAAVALANARTGDREEEEGS